VVVAAEWVSERMHRGNRCVGECLAREHRAVEHLERAAARLLAIVRQRSADSLDKQPQRLACEQIGIVVLLGWRLVYASIACTIASMPVAAVTCGGRPSVSSASSERDIG
jgi:hypothetical protein